MSVPETEVPALAAGVRAGQRRALAKAITLAESTREEHQARAEALLQALLPGTGGAMRLGITGSPGVGKSTFIEAFGLQLVEAGKRVAVLAIDPSSARTGGSLLGDKTRMPRLAAHERAFVRPSPAGGALGGVGHHTREAMLLCEAAGYDVVIVETVGVGQSEVTVASMVDFFLVLVQPGAGDELQGLKKGIVELAEGIAVTKADGEGQRLAALAVAEYRSALRLLRSPTEGWEVPVSAVSAVTGSGLPEVWDAIVRHRALLEARGELAQRRLAQDEAWFWGVVRYHLERRVLQRPEVRAELPRLLAAVTRRELTPAGAAMDLLVRLGPCIAPP